MTDQSKAFDPNDKSWLIGCWGFVVVVGFMIYGCQNSTGKGDFDEKASGYADLQASLRDPSSIEVRNDFVSKSGAYCGEVNAANGFGGKAGFKRFVVKAGRVSIDDDAKIAPIWITECK